MEKEVGWGGQDAHARRLDRREGSPTFRILVLFNQKWEEQTTCEPIWVPMSGDVIHPRNFTHRAAVNQLKIQHQLRTARDQKVA